LFDLAGHFLVIQVGADHLAERTVFLGDLRKADAVADDCRVGKLLFQFLVFGQGFFKALPHRI
jgi:hypothetical protein